MNIIQGDLIAFAKEGYFDVIIHGCNCFKTMGSGIALQIKNAFPEAYQADLDTVAGDDFKLGMYSSAIVNPSPNVCFVVVNAYTQYRYGYSEQYADYDAIRKVFRLIKANYTGRRIAYPKIGAGQGRGDWNIISTIIDQELAGENHTCVVL